MAEPYWADILIEDSSIVIAPENAVAAHQAIKKWAEKCGEDLGLEYELNESGDLTEALAHLGWEGQFQSSDGFNIYAENWAEEIVSPDYLLQVLAPYITSGAYLDAYFVEGREYVRYYCKDGEVKSVIGRICYDVPEGF